MKFLGSEVLHVELRLGFLFMMCYVVRIDREKVLWVILIQPTRQDVSNGSNPTQ